jgi:hypothetical protein
MFAHLVGAHTLAGSASERYQDSKGAVAAKPSRDLLLATPEIGIHVFIQTRVTASESSLEEFWKLSAVWKLPLVPNSCVMNV